MTIVFIALALLLLVVVALFARGTTQRVETLDSVAELAVNVDVAALHRLLNPEDDRFLRARLPSTTYWRLRRRRSRLVLSYVRVMLHNTNILMAFASSVRHRSNPELAPIAAEVIHTAMLVRFRLATVFCRTIIDWALPFLPSSLELSEPYRQLQDRAALLFRMLDPRESSQALAAI